jgi:two-component system, cell cycle sensor histidine kinase and response regulator CckA
LLERPELLSSLLAGMQDGLSIIDDQQAQVFVNDALCKMLGFSREELLGKKPPYPYWPSEEVPAISEALKRTVTGDVMSFDLVFKRKDGERIAVIVAPSTVRDASGAVLAYFATVKDMSAHKKLEQSLLASEQRWRAIAENPYDFIVLIDRGYRFTYVNHTAPGVLRESLVGQATPFDYVDPRYHDLMRSSFETTFETGRATSYDVYVPQLDIWMSNVVGAVTEHGRVTMVSILTRDITAQKRAEEALKLSEQRQRESRKMETIGTLAGGIAHDINNILTPILAYAELGQRILPATHEVREYLSGITLASQRARDLVQRILLFSRKQELKRTVFDLRQAISEDAAMLRVTVPADVELVIQLPEDPIWVSADRAQLGQVLGNLATNALQSMQSSGGKLTISLAPGTAGEQSATLTVADSGVGMDAETTRRVFEPFFTTKPIGDGTGLGLSIVDGVVRDHGGEIAVASAPGQGATFTISLPTTSGRPAPPEASRPKSLGVAAMRVLVVDDEPAIVSVVRQALTSAGHIVTPALSAAAALEIIRRDPAAFDVVLTDQSMPNMTGTSLIAELRSLAPSLSCLLMTGLDDEVTERRARTLDVFEIIAKPFSLPTLVATVERAGNRSKPR